MKKWTLFVVSGIQQVLRLFSRNGSGILKNFGFSKNLKSNRDIFGFLLGFKNFRKKQLMAFEKIWRLFLISMPCHRKDKLKVKYWDFIIVIMIFVLNILLDWCHFQEITMEFWHKRENMTYGVKKSMAKISQNFHIQSKYKNY